MTYPRLAAARLAAALLASSLAWACGGTNEPEDGGADSGAPMDAGSTDAGSTDAGSTDAGSTDSGSTDSGMPSPVSGPSGGIVFDFEDQTLQGFEAIQNDAVAGMGVSNEIAVGPGGETRYGLEPLDFNGQRDADHDVVIFRSPELFLDGSQDVRARATGGVGDGSMPSAPTALPARTDAAGPHPLGIAVRLVDSGAYVAFGALAAPGEPFADIVIPAAALDAADRRRVTVDVIDAAGGGPFSWLVVDDVRLSGWSTGGACDASPCADMVACTDEPGSFPGFACGACPAGSSGDGVTCTPDVPPVAVVSTTPADGAMVRFTDTPLFAGELDRITMNFDQPVFTTGPGMAPLVITAVNSSASFTQSLVVRPRAGGDGMDLVLDSSGAAYSAFPAGETVVTIEQVRSAAGNPPLATYSWSFTVRTCGDGTCDSDESSCTCAADCGSCSGCCRGGRTEAPALVCLPGTANDACGRLGASCNVCVSPTTCQGGVGCG